MELFILRRAGCGAVFLANALQFNQSEITVHWSADALPQDSCYVLGFSHVQEWTAIRALSDPRMPQENSSTIWLDHRADVMWDCLQYLTWDRFESAYRDLLVKLSQTVDYDQRSLAGYWQDYMTTMGMSQQE
jgi:hypothetical protein